MRDVDKARFEALGVGGGTGCERDELAWGNALGVRSEPVIKSVRLLGGVHAVAVDGSAIDLPSASQRRLLAILALHSPRRLRSEWLPPPPPRPPPPPPPRRAR